jgi:hypothetical protein
MTLDYSDWIYNPNRTRPPGWVHDFIAVVRKSRQEIDSAKVASLVSDRVLSYLRPGLETLGYQVEAGKKMEDRIRRPVLFGPGGEARVTYEVDAVHDDLGIMVEVEAGRGARGNAVYRDLIRSSLIVDARYLVLGVMREYHHLSSGHKVIVNSDADTRDQIDAIFASGRLKLPFEGVLLFGY